MYARWPTPFQVDKKQHAVRHKPAQCPDLGCEEVSGNKHVQMRANKLLPCGRGLALWRWWHAMALENVAYGLVISGTPQVSQSPHNAIVVPLAILLGHADNQGLQIWVDLRSSWWFAMLGAVKLLRYERTMPTENGIGLDNLDDFFQ